MFVIDDLRSAQQQAVVRLNDLKPLVAEYEDLRREVKRLGHHAVLGGLLTDPPEALDCLPDTRSAHARSCSSAPRIGAHA